MFARDLVTLRNTLHTTYYNIIPTLEYYTWNRIQLRKTALQ